MKRNNKKHDGQTTNTILMVRPANFGYNPETAQDNAFQEKDGTLTVEEVKEAGRREFDAFAEVLKNEGVTVLVVEDTAIPFKTDAVFPNNWFTTHAEGDLILYPLFSPARRNERREDIVDMLVGQYGFFVNRIYLPFEKRLVFLEGTGSMILDRVKKVVYACLSERTHHDLLLQWAEDRDYRTVVFHAVDHDDVPYYHTNVIMTLGTHFALICLESIEDNQERQMLIESLDKTGKDIIPLTRWQILEFAGNALEVRDATGNNLLVMSESAYKSLTPSQIDKIEKYARIVHSPLNIIEKYGGGSARCMMAEIFLPKK